MSRPICRCNAYEFPHKLGGGNCINTSIEGPICGECRCYCSPRWVDYGTGPGECRGTRYIDSQWDYVSDCCEAEVYADQTCTNIYDSDFDEEMENDTVWDKVERELDGMKEPL